MSVGKSVPLLCFSLCAAVGVACDGRLDEASGGNDAGADAAPTDGFAGPAPTFASYPGYGAPPALKFRLRAGRGNGAVVEEAALLGAMQKAEAVCLGETHDSFAVHSMQLLILDRLRRMPDAAFAVGMEMFQRPFQSILTRYGRGEIDEGAMRAQTEYDARWRFDWELYRPLVLHAVTNRHPLLALNAARELTQRVAAVGVEGLTADERAQLPEMNFGDAQHLAWFEAQVSSGHGTLTPQRLMQLYTVQVVWDETMADTATAWLKSAAAHGIAIVAGRGHCVDGGIPSRMQRRGVQRTISLQIIDDEPGSVEEAVLSDPADYIIGVSLQ